MDKEDRGTGTVAPSPTPCEVYRKMGFSPYPCLCLFHVPLLFLVFVVLFPSLLNIYLLIGHCEDTTKGTTTLRWTALFHIPMQKLLLPEIQVSRIPLTVPSAFFLFLHHTPSFSFFSFFFSFCTIYFVLEEIPFFMLASFFYQYGD